MSVELRPLGVNCNIACQYCYQNPQRDAGNLTQSYDLELMKAAVEREGGSFILFGGEPLLLPEQDLEALWAWGLEKYGSNGIQTNGTLINDNHIRMFKQYQVQVGISIDGPSELNDVRWAGSLERTRQQTAQVEAVIERLLKEGIVPSLIVTLHRGNATPDKLPLMHDWFRSLDRAGIQSVRLHILQVDYSQIQNKYALSLIENIQALLSFAELEQELTTLTPDVFRDVENLLLATDNEATCVWRACDPYTTSAVRGVEGKGQRSNCGRTNKDGIDFVKADSAGYERYLALYHTPQEYGGCQGCRFFVMCKGQCPGTAIAGDWRNRTEHCSVWKQLFEYLEQRLLGQGKTPISLDANLHYLEENMLDDWQHGLNPSLNTKLNEMRAIAAQQPPLTCALES
ncbi:radical SAM protein [Microcoleus sp. FACHB-53]|nr:radical SAM protein [Microcoleus sp. FACHB-53]MBD2129581.1 radical SAM protein [Microcoleus sp. FACHB-1]